MKLKSRESHRAKFRKKSVTNFRSLFPGTNATYS